SSTIPPTFSQRLLNEPLLGGNRLVKLTDFTQITPLRQQKNLHVPLSCIRSRVGFLPLDARKRRTNDGVPYGVRRLVAAFLLTPGPIAATSRQVAALQPDQSGT